MDETFTKQMLSLIHHQISAISDRIHQIGDDLEYLEALNKLLDSYKDILGIILQYQKEEK